MIPQYLKEKSFSKYYKLVTVSVLLLSLLPELPALLCVAALFVFYLVHCRKNKLQINISKTGGIIIIYDIFALVSVIWSGSRISTLYYAFMWLCAFALFLIISGLSDTREKIENIVLCLVGSAAANSVLAILQMSLMAVGKSQFFPSPLYERLDLWFARLVNYPLFFESAPDRVSGCFANPLAFSAFLVLIFPLSVFCAFYGATKKRRWFSIASSVLIFFGLLFTFLRGSVVAVVLSLMMLSFAGKKPAKFMSGIASAASISMLIIIYLRRGITASQDISTNYRLPIWKACLNSFLSKPVGLGAGSENVRRMLFDNGLELVNAHNLPVEILTELGVAGLLIFAVLVTLTVRDLFLIYNCGGWYKRYATAFGASLVGFFAMSLFESTLDLPKEISYFVIVLACIEATKKLAVKQYGKLK